MIGPLALVTALAGGATRIVQDQCGSFTDVSPAFCPYVLEMYYLGITAGTSATTFSPDNPVTRGQAAVFVSKAINQTLARSSRHAALGQWWTATSSSSWSAGLGITPMPDYPGPFGAMASDGTDIWVAGYSSVFRFRASDGRYLETWTIDATAVASWLLVATGRVFVGAFPVPGGGSPLGSLYIINPSQTAGNATLVATLPSNQLALAFDGANIWSADASDVSIITLSPTAPWPVSTITTGFQYPVGVVFDGSNVWVADDGPCALLKVDNSGAVLQTVSLGSAGCYLNQPVFDGSNLLVPNRGVGLNVVRVSDGAVVKTISPSTDGGPDRAAFDGERILVVSDGGGQDSPPDLMLLRAADFSILREEIFSPFGGSAPGGGTTDGLNFWVLFDVNGPVLARY